MLLSSSSKIPKWQLLKIGDPEVKMQSFSTFPHQISQIEEIVFKKQQCVMSLYYIPYLLDNSQEKQLLAQECQFILFFLDT
jgi:hypothetical protein